MVLRRKFLLLATTAAVVVPLFGCGTTPISQIAQDVETIAAGLAAVLPAIQGFVPTKVYNEASAIINSIEAAAASIAASGTASSSLLQQISTAISALAAILTPFFPIASPVGAAIQAALALIAVVLQLVNPPVPAPTPAPTAKLSVSMTPDQARVILKAAAANGLKR